MIEFAHAEDVAAEVFSPRLQNPVEACSIDLKSKPGTGVIAAVGLESALTIDFIPPDSSMAMESLIQHCLPHTKRFEERFDAGMKRFAGDSVGGVPRLEKSDAYPRKARGDRRRATSRAPAENEDVGIVLSVVNRRHGSLGLAAN